MFVCSQENVGALKVTMDNLNVMQGFKATRRLYENLPNVILIYELVRFLRIFD